MMIGEKPILIQTMMKLGSNSWTKERQKWRSTTLNNNMISEVI